MRVLTVLELLQARERVTGPELARVLEVSPRTVQRYVTRLQDLGIPVTSTRGPGGAYHLRPGFRLPPLMLTNDEALAVTLGLHALAHLGLAEFTPAASGAQAKLRRVLPRDLQERVEDVEGAVDLSAPPWTVPTPAALLADVAHAIRQRRVVSFTYRKHDGATSRRRVEPYGTVHLDGRWYLVGRCQARAALRSFRLDRAADLTVELQAFDRPGTFDAKAYLHDTLPFAHAPHHVDVWLDLPLSDAEAKLVPWRVTLTADGPGTVLRCTREHLGPFAAMLLGLNCDFVVRAPEALRGALRTLAERAARAAAIPGDSTLDKKATKP
ncbi:putative DNA-binding transcriptional regulator YafY [Deinococcus yavapaiensis KR-236]|uniref:Putative DNA-binding transcriptional regulator YafY n=2 Tax=Deinococcus TaxID=1298 RepID=A0A318S651_9DEIO|nr:putative DNA-binding transcriptional regulator YafY [Deinococcus yavapaiensis KR-236]